MERKNNIEKWNKKVACNLPSKKAIKNRQRELQRQRRDRREIVEDSDMYICEAIKQSEEMARYRA